VDWLVIWSLAALVFAPDAWLARESPAVSGSPAFTGYVVEEDGGWTTVLRDDTRTIVEVRDGDLIDRKPCKADGARWLTLPQLWSTPVLPCRACRRMVARATVTG
jgi:hypothetical protein